IAGIDGWVGQWPKTRGLDAVRRRRVHDVVVRVRPIGLTGVRVHAHRQLDDAFANALYFGRIDADTHAVRARGRARGGKTAHPLNLHEARATGAARLLIGIFAQLRNVGTCHVDGVECTRAFRDGDRLPVNTHR